MSLETRIILLTCAVNLLQIYSVAGHSWLTCTDYTEKNGATWDPSKCRGFPRDAARFAPKTGTFGFDTGSLGNKLSISMHRFINVSLLYVSAYSLIHVIIL